MQIWERRRSIPSTGDPLNKIFDAFDSDHDGRCLTARSRIPANSMLGTCQRC